MLHGLEQFDRALKQMEEKARGEVLKKSLLEAVQPAVKKAAELAPSKSGGLKQSMTAQIMSNTPIGEAVVRVGPGRPEGSHGILLEYGTVYMTEKPFLASAYQASFQEVQEIMENEVGNALRG